MNDSEKPVKSKRILSWFFRKRVRPKSRLGRILMNLRWVLYALITAYLLLLLFPQMIFPHHVEKHNIRIYSFDPLSPEADGRLDEICATLRKSQLYDPDVNGRIFICNNMGVYRLFAPFSGEMYAVARPMTGQVIIARGEVATNRTGTTDILTGRRKLTEVVAHEMTHLLIYNHLGFWGNMVLDRWVSEGYCEFVSGNYNYPELAGIKHLISGRKIDDTNFDYFTWETMIMYLIEVKGLSFDEIRVIEDDYDRVKSETVEWLKGVYRNILDGKQEKPLWPKLDS